MSGALLFGVLVVACGAPLVHASATQPPQAAGSAPDATSVKAAKAPSRASAATVVSKVELAAAFQRLEAAVADRPAGMPRAELNRRFDSLTLLFFQNRLAEAVDALDALTLDVLGVKDASERADLLRAVQVRVAPARSALRADDASMAVSVALPRSGEASPIMLRAGGGEPFEVTPPAMVTLAMSEDAGVRTIDVRLSKDPASDWMRLRAVPVTEASPDELRHQAERAIDLAATAGRASATDLDEARARAALLTNDPSPRRTIQLVLDQAQVWSMVRQDLGRLERGEPLFVERRGDQWRMIDVGGVRLPCRVFVPDSVRPESKPPLVIALHGAGGDESMFFSAYGQGEIVRQAQRLGCVVVAPNTTVFATSPVLFDGLVERLEREWGIDRARISVVGHSMGAAATGSIVRVRSAAITRAALLAGWGGFGGVPGIGSGSMDEAAIKGLPPIRVELGALDPLMEAARISASARSLRERGARIECTVHGDEGHTMIVPTVLPAVMEWLVAPPVATPAAPAASPSPAR
jgi:predicted esterase